MLHNPPLQQLSKGEFLRFHKQIIEVCNQFVLTPPIVQALTELQLALAPLEGRLSRLRRVPLTEDLVALNKRRDTALTGLHLLANACSRHYETAIAEAGQTLLKGMDHFGKKLTLLNYMAKTEVIAALVSRLNGNGPMGEAAATLPLVKDWSQELWQANEAFNDTFINRSQIRAAQPTQSFTALRPGINATYQILADRIVAQQTLYPSAAMAELIAVLNELMEGYDELIS